MSEAANTDETPTMVTSTLFIGVMAARSTHTLQHLGITHILCLCANDFGQTDSQLLDIFQYKISRLLLDTLLIFSIWFGEILVS